ncbi:MAG: hypothetical protein A2V79_08480 [Betaproteobacteria bacterium RBG_16_56_24]|nr:MAG: hypothetical protein A2V79_08480 [Betaproteobacteria bacterium RBG_16_56_24]
MVKDKFLQWNYNQKPPSHVSTANEGGKGNKTNVLHGNSLSIIYTNDNSSHLQLQAISGMMPKNNKGALIWTDHNQII